MRIKNYTNAFVRIECDPCVLACDVWKFPVWDGGWATVPFHTSIQEALRGVTHCFISHLHEDHCDPLALAFLPRDTVMIAPNIYPNHLIKIRLGAMGFSDVRLIDTKKPYPIGSGLTLEVIPPLNRFAQQEDLYDDEDTPDTGIDCGVIVSDHEAKVVLLSDNSPYNLADAGESLERMRNADLLAFPFNGFADDYPVCYDNFSKEEKKRIARERNEKRTRITSATLKQLNPKFLMPYSSDFLVKGPRALEFVDIQPTEWMDRPQAAKSFEAATGIKNLVVYECDTIEIDSKGLKLTKGNQAPPSMHECAASQYNPIPNTRYLYPPISSLDALFSTVDQAAKNMFMQMRSRRLRSDWMLGISLLDWPDEPMYAIDVMNHHVGRSIDPSRKLLTCYLESNYLNAILTGRASWNGAQGSYNLTWTRVPSEYDFHLYRSLHFFNAAGSGTRASLGKVESA